MSNTPMMRQYLAIKEQYPDQILFYRMGDFYEMFFDDAIKGAKLLGIALTKRGKSTNGQEIPMCGVPAHSYLQYLERLIKAGQQVAICDQLETPEEAKKRGYKSVVKREVTRIITPGTILEENLLDCASHNFLCAMHMHKKQCYFAFLDMGTKDVYFSDCSQNAIQNEISRIVPKELLISQKVYNELRNKGIDQSLGEYEKMVSTRSDSIFNIGRAKARILSLYEIADLAIIEGMKEQHAVALGVLFEYLEHTQKDGLTAPKLPKAISVSHHMSIDANALNNLEIVDNQKASYFTLFNALNHTKTQMGARLLHSRLVRPLLSVDAINRRLDNVEGLVASDSIRALLLKVLPKMPDISRLISKISYGRAGPRDLKMLQHALQGLDFLSNQFCELQSNDIKLPNIISKSIKDFDEFGGLIHLLEAAIVDDPPLMFSVGNCIRYRYESKLDALLEFKSEVDTNLKKLRQKYADISGVNNLKISSNNMIGYYIEVTQQHASKMNPNLFKHKQSLANATRFTTQELAELQENLAHVDERIKNLELQIFEQICAEILNHAERIEFAATTMAEVDFYLSAAIHAKSFNHVRPTLSQDVELEIKDGKHPIIQVENSEFIANDLKLNDFDRIWLLTGPNMAGKSTFLRQNALIVIMAQMGFFVPASSATVGIVDKVFSRIGASDNAAKGQSTFMIEMLESSYVLNNATAKSLIIFDEIGRGTATYDGLALAWSMLEYLHNKIKARTLFASHYHELKELVPQLQALSIHTPKIEEWQGKIIFKYKIETGAAEGSYGIHVAALAGIPAPILNRARTVLSQFENDHLSFSGVQVVEQVVESAINDNEKIALGKLRDASINEMTPIDALNFLHDLKGSV